MLFTPSINCDTIYTIFTQTMMILDLQRKECVMFSWTNIWFRYECSVLIIFIALIWIEHKEIWFTKYSKQPSSLFFYVWMKVSCRRTHWLDHKCITFWNKRLSHHVDSSAVRASVGYLRPEGEWRTACGCLKMHPCVLLHANLLFVLPQ